MSVRNVCISSIALVGAFVMLTPLAAALPRPTAATLPLYVAPSGSDSGRCTRAAPCASFGRAYRVALPGQVVQVAAGTYPAQEIDRDASKTSPNDVVFQPAPGASVVVDGQLALGNGQGIPAAAHVTFKGMRANEIQAFNPATDVTWSGMTARNFYFRGVRDVVVKGGSFGPCTSSIDPCGNNKIDYASPPEQANANITIDGALFHDFRIGNPGDHFECVFLFSGTNITIRNSTFRNCEFYDLFLQHAGGTLAGLTIEKNHFGVPWNGAGVQNRVTAIGFSPRGTPFSDVVLRRNSFDDGTGVAWNDDGDGSTYTNFQAVANMFGIRANCESSVAYSDNLWPVDGKCGTNDRSVPFGYVRRDGKLEPDPARAPRIQKAFAGAAVPTQPLKRVARSVGWSLTTLRRILKDPVYMGGIFGAPGSHPALVAKPRWHAVQKRLAKS